MKHIYRITCWSLAMLMAMATATAQEAEELVELSLEDLMNMEVTVASKKAEKISDAAGVISVISMDDIERFGGITLRDMLERVTGLIGVAGNAFSEPYGVASRGDQIRGNSGHILILINGRPTREILEGGVSSEMFAAFPVNIIERIEVIRGPGSVLYGSNAFSSVINIVTKEVEANNVAVSAMTGSNGAVGANGSATILKGDFSVLLAGRYLDKGDPSVYDYRVDLFDPTSVFEGETDLKDEAAAGFVSMKYKGLSITSAHNAYRATYFSGGSAQLGEYMKWQKTFNNLGYDLAVGDKWDMNFNVTYNYATMKSGETIGVERKSNDLVAEWTNHISFGDKSRLVVGGLYNYIKGSEYFINIDETISEANRGSFAMYSQLDYWAIESLKLIAGFQANKVEGQDLDVVPRLGAVWYPFERLNVKALYSQAFRAPSVNELSIDAPFLLGDPNLDPEKIGALDIGVNYQGERFQAGINYFKYKQKDIITLVVLDVNNFRGQYQNLGEIDFQGAEFEGKLFINRELMLTGSVIYQENEDQEGDEDVTPVSNLGGKIGISYKWGNGITISLFDIYQGKYGDSYVGSDFNPKPEAYNELNLYASFDLVKLFNMGIKQELSLFVQANNILDEEIWIPVDYIDTVPKMPGRFMLFGAKFSLN